MNTGADSAERSHPLLSICIPTYNRAGQLEEVVAALLIQVRSECPRRTVEVVVSDNGSTDGTRLLMEDMVEIYPELRYSRLEHNAGFARNAVNAVMKARGEFVALAGDDDLFMAGAVARMLDATLSGSSVIIVNSAPVSDAMLPDAIDLPDAAACIEHLGVFHASFIANALVRRDLFLECLTDDLLESAYVHTGVIFRALGRASGVFQNFATVRPHDRLRTWRSQQPLYTAVDMARLVTDEVFSQRSHAWLVWRSYALLVRSVPRAVVGAHRGQITADTASRFGSVGLANILDCYRASRLFQSIAGAAWCISRLISAASRPSTLRA